MLRWLERFRVWRLTREAGPRVQRQLAPTEQQVRDFKAEHGYSPAVVPLKQTKEQQAHNEAIDQEWREERERRIAGLRDGSLRPRFLDLATLMANPHPEVQALFTDGSLPLRMPEVLTDAQVDGLVAAGAVDVEMTMGMRSANVTHYDPPQPLPSEEERAKLAERQELRRKIRHLEREGEGEDMPATQFDAEYAAMTERERFYIEAGVSDSDILLQANGDEAMATQLRAKREEVFASLFKEA